MYSTQEQVADEFSGIPAGGFSSSTNPTLTTVERWIAEADQLIDSKVGLRYVVPISNATDLLLIRQISILIASARVRRRLNRTGPDGEAAKVKVTDTLDQAMKMLNEIVTGKITLPGSTLLDADMGVGSFSTSLECPHHFKKDCDNW